MHCAQIEKKLANVSFYPQPTTTASIQSTIAYLGETVLGETVLGEDSWR